MLGQFDVLQRNVQASPIWHGMGRIDGEVYQNVLKTHGVCADCGDVVFYEMMNGYGRWYG